MHSECISIACDGYPQCRCAAEIAKNVMPWSSRSMLRSSRWEREVRIHVLLAFASIFRKKCIRTLRKRKKNNVACVANKKYRCTIRTFFLCGECSGGMDTNGDSMHIRYIKHSSMFFVVSIILLLHSNRSVYESSALFERLILIRASRDLEPFALHTYEKYELKCT